MIPFLFIGHEVHALNPRPRTGSLRGLYIWPIIPSLPHEASSELLVLQGTKQSTPASQQVSRIWRHLAPVGGGRNRCRLGGYNRRPGIACPSGAICPANTLSLVGLVAAVSLQENPRVCRTSFIAAVSCSFARVVAHGHVPASRRGLERPSAPKLLPKKTLAYVRIADSRELAESFMKTSVGRLSQDEKIKPLIMHLYGSVTQAFSQIQDEIGVSLGEILSIPQGEVCGALIGREQGPPAFVVLVEVGDKMPIVRRLLERAEQEVVRNGGSKRTEEVDGVTVSILEGDDEGGAVCERDGVVLVGSDPGLIKEVLKTWTGDEGAETLADNREFTAIMSRSVGTKDERPQVTWFVDPIELAKNLMREEAGGQMAVGDVARLGLDGIKAAGGSMIYATEEFDSIAHMHLLLDNPRTGVLEMLALESGDTSPEDWVPHRCGFLHDDQLEHAARPWRVLRKLFDQIQRPGGDEQRHQTAPVGSVGCELRKGRDSSRSAIGSRT